MKAYGYKRRDSQTCQYGCCGRSKGNVTNRRPIDKKRVDRAARKRARRTTNFED